MRVRKLAYGCGAEITDVDLSADLPQSTIDDIREAWLKHVILVFPNQDFTIDQHIRFSRRFGELESHPMKNLRSPLGPEILEIHNRVIDGKPSETGDIGRNWHSDGAFTTQPPTGSFLHCRAMPEAGGNTWFNNMYMAYETLSPKMKNIIADLEVVNDINNIYIRAGGVGRRDPHKVAEDNRLNPPVIQSMVRVHSETGRKALYLSEAVTQRIVGLTQDEGAGILQYLFKHSVRPEFTYRHYWRINDLVLWDNRCAMHLAPRDYDPGEIRHMCRTTLTGEKLGRYLDQLPA